MLEKYITHPSDLINHQKVKIFQSLTKLALLQRDLNNNQEKINLSKIKLPSLLPELTLLETTLSSLKEEISTLSLASSAHDADLSKTLNLLIEIDQKLLKQEHDKNLSLAERNKLIQMWMNGTHLMQNKSEIYLAKLNSKKFADVGTGIDYIEFESNPLAEVQIQSLEDEIKKIDNATAHLIKEKSNLVSNAFTLINEKREALRNIKAKVNSLANQINLLGVEIKKREILKEIAEEESLYGAAMRGDVKQINQLLSKGALPNKTNLYGKKPLYYACRGGYPEAVIQLTDYTDISKTEEDELIQVLPNLDKKMFARMYSAIKSSKHIYDHLWDENKSLGDNIKSVFQDYFSPTILKHFEFLPNQMKRFLTLNWNRKYLEVANDIVIIFSKIEPELKQDRTLCQLLINGKWNAFFEQDPQPNSNESFARRLNYVKNKLEPHQKKIEHATTLCTSLFGLLSREALNASQVIQMQPIPESELEDQISLQSCTKK